MWNGNRCERACALARARNEDIEGEQLMRVSESLIGAPAGRHAMKMFPLEYLAFSTRRPVEEDAVERVT